MANVLHYLIISVLILLSDKAISADNSEVEYQVPDGFSPSEQDSSIQLLATLDGRALPGALSWSTSKKRLVFDDKLYQKNGISEEQVNLLNKVLSDIPYSSCLEGCDYITHGQFVTLDKVKQSLTISNSKQLFVQPDTSISLVHNQSIDVRTASNSYRAVSSYGQGYLGLPSQSYGYLNWYYNDVKNFNTKSREQGVSTWYLQKNFTSTYLRAGRQDSLDSAAGSISTSLNPSFDQFITLGSQDNLKKDNKSAGKLVLFANSDGDYEFYRDGRLIRRLSAVLGRNEIDYNQLPGGFYSVEIRLVNRSGQVISREVQQIANVNYGGGAGWYITLGNELNSNEGIAHAGASYQTRWFSASSALIKGTGKSWATEHNITRPMEVAGVELTPTAGLMAGEKHAGSYFSINSGNTELGYLTASQYQNTSVSTFYPARNSTSISYGRQFGQTRVGYNYSNYSNSERHQLQTTWNLRNTSLWAVISTGIQKGGFDRNNNNYGLYINTTIMLDGNTGTFNAAYNNGKLRTGGSYTRESEDSYGTTYSGVDFSQFGRTNAIGLNLRRSGSRGDSSMRLGVNDTTTNGSFNYNGMFAVSKDGAAFGRTSSSGAAMLVKTPNVGVKNYGFKVEGFPVGGDSSFAVPLATYQDVTFARAQTVNDDFDMNIRLPANVTRAHPGQVYPVKAEVEINMLYNGFMVDNDGNPITGTIKETGDTVYPNGLFSITSSMLLKEVNVNGKQHGYRCDLSQPNGKRFLCKIE